MSNLDELRYFTYTHTNAADVWRPYFGLLEKHSPELKHTVIVNKVNADIPFSLNEESDFCQLEYNDNANYCQEYINCLLKTKEDYIIYMQEDFYLYKDIDRSAIASYIDVLESDREVSFVRLCKQPFFDIGLFMPEAIVERWRQLCKITPTWRAMDEYRKFVTETGVSKSQMEELRCIDTYTNSNVSEIPYSDTLFWTQDPSKKLTAKISYSMQPTIWRKSDLINLYERCNRYKFGEGDDWTDAMNNVGTKGLYHYDGEPQRGLLHRDSNVFPYVLTAIVKGMWNTMEYPEMVEIINDYRIDPLVRGELNSSNMHGSSWHQG
jgi:hypothetical protein